MKVNDGYENCKECNGSGILPLDDFACSNCGGSGKVDWVTNAMESIKKSDFLYNQGSISLATNAPADIEFYTNNIVFLKICQNGDFLVKGKKVKNDKKIYDGFVEFLKSAGYY